MADRIPRILHYCWFGPAEPSSLALRCMESWRVHCPDFEIRRWDETTFDVSAHPYTAAAHAAKKYAFVSDVVRAQALFEVGGIYLDTDVELKDSLVPFLVHDAFSGFECIGRPFTALWGAAPGHSWPGAVVDNYRGRVWSATEQANTTFVSDIVVSRFGIDPDVDELQIGSDGVAIYPSTMFCLDLPRNVASHHFEGSWTEGRSRPYKARVHVQHSANELAGEMTRVDVAYFVRRLVAERGLWAALQTVLLSGRVLVREAVRRLLRR